MIFLFVVSAWFIRLYTHARYGFFGEVYFIFFMQRVVNIVSTLLYLNLVSSEKKHDAFDCLLYILRDIPILRHLIVSSSYRR
jgi:hypothetical protein